ncbi:MAG: hypothetical protein KME26_21165 [Oscillatoria princeps RMCB-10]|nr:hypothetical protein [Oscillatoria princeps RMCB-10]
MRVKFFSAHLNAGLALGAFLMVLQTASPAPAQNGNQSDITGPIPTTSDIAGGAFTTTTGAGGTETVFTGGASAQASVNQAAATVSTQLSAGSISAVTGGSISAPAQTAVFNILTANAELGSSVSAVANSLTSAPGAPPATAVQNLLDSLVGLLRGRKITPAKLLAAIRAYNAMIDASNAEFLSSPPSELLAIQAALSKLIAAAG